jgi:NADH-quinone oxidoreductase subunit N
VNLSAFQTMLPTSLLLAGATLVALLGAAFREMPPLISRVVALVALLAAIVAALFTLRAITGPVGVGADAFAGSVVADRFSVYAVVLVCGVGVLCALGSGTAGERLAGRAAAFHALLLTATAGATVIAGQWEMGMLVAGLALLLPALVGMAALDKATQGAGEAALRQLAETAVALAVLLLGLALVYGATGSTDLGAVRTQLPGASPALQGLGLALTLLGLVQLVGATPLHRWLVLTVRSSHGAVAAAVVGLSTATGGVALIRVFVSGFTASFRPWVVLAAVVAVIATLYPAVLSLRAVSVRTLVALGISIQGGLLLAALLATGTAIDGRTGGGLDAALFGMVGFVLATLACLLALGILDGVDLGSGIADLRGLSRRHPLSAALLALGLAGLAGLPPLAGFLTRILVAQSDVAAGYAWVAVATGAATVIYAVPVLRALAAMFVEDEDEPAVVSGVPRLSRLAAGAAAVFGILAMILAGPLMYAANSAGLTLH